MIICIYILSFVIFYNLDDLKLNYFFVKYIYYLYIVLGLFFVFKFFVKIIIIFLDYILKKEIY